MDTVIPLVKVETGSDSDPPLSGRRRLISSLAASGLLVTMVLLLVVEHVEIGTQERKHRIELNSVRWKHRQEQALLVHEHTRERENLTASLSEAHAERVRWKAAHASLEVSHARLKADRRAENASNAELISRLQHEIRTLRAELWAMNTTHSQFQLQR